MQWAYRSAVLLLLCLLGWQVYVYGMGRLAGETSGQLTQPASAYEPIATHYRPSADTLVASAEQANESGDKQLSTELALRALAENPTSGRAAAHLLALYSAQDSTAKASEIADIAGKLWPAHSYTHSRLADYWVTQQRLDKLFPEWNILLTRNGALRSQLFPAIYQITAKPEYTPLLKPYIDNPPLWWNAFFAYLTREAEPEFLRKVYEQRLVSSIPLDDSEKSSYVGRLLKDKHWGAARDAWLKGISKTQQQYGGLVYDAGFEGESFNTGFDWQIAATKEISIKPDLTYGVKGRQAIHINIRKGQPVNFQHLSQRLVLSPGDYQLSLLYRLDTFKANKGLSWRIRCLDNPDTVIAETDALKGQKPWSTLSTFFSVPAAGCEAQLLRLEAASRYRHDQTFEGNIWFDNVSITPASGKHDEQ